jgi:hypothetical protein
MLEHKRELKYQIQVKVLDPFGGGALFECQLETLLS